ncbi:hypothetical protein MP228_001030 [Amoeboaphelidium protococcarum]|nr:hypothetical protein MP228_001030 [Amoeboaphelidium protococcarum]
MDQDNREIGSEPRKQGYLLQLSFDNAGTNSKNLSPGKSLKRIFRKPDAMKSFVERYVDIKDGILTIAESHKSNAKLMQSHDISQYHTASVDEDTANQLIILSIVTMDATKPNLIFGIQTAKVNALEEAKEWVFAIKPYLKSIDSSAEDLRITTILQQMVDGSNDVDSVFLREPAQSESRSNTLRKKFSIRRLGDRLLLKRKKQITDSGSPAVSNDSIFASVNGEAHATGSLIVDIPVFQKKVDTLKSEAPTTAEAEQFKTPREVTGDIAPQRDLKQSTDAISHEQHVELKSESAPPAVPDKKQAAINKDAVKRTPKLDDGFAIFAVAAIGLVIFEALVHADKLKAIFNAMIRK